MKEQLINDVLQFLSGKLPPEYNTDLRLYLYYQMAEYDVIKKCTDVAVLDEKTYMDYLYMYLAALKMAGRSDKTIEHYKLQLGLMLHTLKKSVQDITTEDLFTYLAQCKAVRQVGNRYLNNKRICFNSFFTWLQKKKHIIYNPAKTAFMLQAESMGIPAVGGLAMLVAQAKYAAESQKALFG